MLLNKHNTITFITNNVDGGIASFIRYLTRNNISNNTIIVIATTDISNKNTDKINPKNFCNNLIFKEFKYHKFDKRNRILKRLYKLIPEDSIIVANDWLELEMSSYLKIRNPLAYILHGDYPYYYNLAKQHQNSIDSFITINKGMQSKLEKLIPHRINDITTQYPPVPYVPAKENNMSDKPLSIIYAGWINDNKGVFLFPEIDARLKKQNTIVSWNIYGIGNINELRKLWKNCDNVKFHNKIANKELIQEYKNNDIVILLSKAESLGLTIIEGMKASLVPIVNKLETGICEFISNNENGFLVDRNNIENIVSIISNLNKQRDSLLYIGNNARQTSNKLFDEKTNSKLYFEKFYSAKLDLKRKINTQFCFSNRLDNSVLPNLLVRNIRLIKNATTSN
ncbi:glycosyltransferase family 4 protein [Plebeiibacterium sediminum]|uniref:Glycosyltransferase family 4 protein n=1 Tax=Plebeiibacterium sediminum TaxID=2992112 RepID=A0AAE3SH49_9BACT|nr:glycosyltransferase family 4 protein [Plebeiobacterium sediminum]MCW3789195.1 glycosyltransferase family 4 protein [Plebeiobacterium sediminum]